MTLGEVVKASATEGSAQRKKQSAKLMKFIRPYKGELAAPDWKLLPPELIPSLRLRVLFIQSRQAEAEGRGRRKFKVDTEKDYDFELLAERERSKAISDKIKKKQALTEKEKINQVFPIVLPPIQEMWEVLEDKLPELGPFPPKPDLVLCAFLDAHPCDLFTLDPLTLVEFLETVSGTLHLWVYWHGPFAARIREMATSLPFGPAPTHFFPVSSP